MGTFEFGFLGDWTYPEIREHNLYEVVGECLLPGRLHFVLMHIAVPLAPTAILLIFEWIPK